MNMEKYRGFGGSGFEFFVAEEIERTINPSASDKSDGGVFLAIFPEDRLEAAARNIGAFCGYLRAPADAVVFPSEDSGRRLMVYARLTLRESSGRALVVVASPEALAEAGPSRKDFVRGGGILRPRGKSADLADLLSSSGYKRVDYVESAGQFAVRGQITDFWSPSSERPVRAVFDGDIVERLRFFDPSEQITVADAPSAEIVPAEERRSAEPAMSWFRGCRAVFAVSRPAASADGPLPPRDIAALDAVIAPARFVLHDPFDGDSLDAGFLSASFYGGDVPSLERDIKSLAAAGYKKILFAPSPGEAARFAELLEMGSGGGAGNFEIFSGKITEGFVRPSGGIFLISAEQFFLRSAAPAPFEKIKAPSRRSEGLWEMAAGDFVVHERYGVGKYRGIVTMDDPPQEFLAVEYKSGDTIYVPVYDFARIKKYIGAEGVRPKISDLDAPGVWARSRERAKHSAEVFAAELLNLYAERERASAAPMTHRTVWEDELEQSFPFEETPDQREAIKAALADLSGVRPADRVVLGDVGFGKTEVALRAAFKAAVNSCQTALVVPTTILAMQHFSRFSERLAPFPVKVAALHRFQSPSEQKKAVSDIASGAVDIVIGTHRILSSDISFKNLGLLIIDEEHRFGVRQKEKLRRFSKNVHTILMSATPIPRTLGAALNGIKDISIIETPPAGRKPVETIVAPRSPRCARDAIVNELARGGQVFYVHNTIKELPRKLSELSSEAPRARWGVIHGRMKAETVEKTLYEFYGGKLDCLLSTAIVESGLDIPQVNTMIVDDAQNFGLAQLYQLRGRVGRGDKKAYCYLFYDDKNLPDDAARRLDALREFSALGSGWRLARRDLEIRGAGALFGYRQHGFLASVGFDLYAKLIAEAVRKLGRKPSAVEGVPAARPLADIEPAIDLHLDARIPPAYVPDDTIRISFYRRFVSADDEAEIVSAQDALKDRFGSPPREVFEVAEAARLRLFMRRKLILAVRPSGGGSETEICFSEGVRIGTAGIRGLIDAFGGHVRFAADSNTIIVSVSPPRAAASARALLEKVSKFATIEGH